MEFLSGRLSLLRTRPVIQKINRFLTTPLYILSVMLLIMLANDAGYELPVYTVILLAGCYICLFADDLLPLMPMVTGCYISVSAQNNPGINPNSVFATWGLYIALILIPFVLCLIFRLATDKDFGGKAFFQKKRYLIRGMILLGIAYLLGGLYSIAYPHQWNKNILMACLQFAVIFLPYYIFTGAVNWKKAPKHYFPWIGFMMGCMLVLQIIRIYIHRGVIVDGVILRNRIYTGWGMYNNIGSLLAMMIPFAFYLASRYHKGWIGSVIGSLFLIGVFFTCSRGSILMGGGAYLLCIILLMRSAMNKKAHTITISVFCVLLVSLVIIFHSQVAVLFRSVLGRGLDPNNRDWIYTEGLKQFARYPIFGGSFYPIDFAPYDWATVGSFSEFLPPRWHNTVIQLLASTGVVGLAAYIYHRYQTVRLFLDRKNRETAFIVCSIAVLLGCSLLDCHLFNLGPALFYSTGLAFVECCTTNKK